MKGTTPGDYYGSMDDDDVAVPRGMAQGSPPASPAGISLRKNHHRNRSALLLGGGIVMILLVLVPTLSFLVGSSQGGGGGDDVIVRPEEEESSSSSFRSTSITASLIDQVDSTPKQQQYMKNHHHYDPETPLYFDQIINHNNEQSSSSTFTTTNTNNNTFRQRYYKNDQYWNGPGSPIFVIFGGEGPLERILYPFVSETLANHYGAITYNLEHRYFGESYPPTPSTPQKSGRPPQEEESLLTPQQAIQDMVYFIQTQRHLLGCSLDKSSTHYCPVLTVGASYAGLLSTLIRKAYPQIVDMAYAGSPCLLLFQHATSPYVYYEYVTQVAERISPGCPTSTKTVLNQLQVDLLNAATGTTGQEKKSSALHQVAVDYGVCASSTGDDDNDVVNQDDYDTAQKIAHQLISYTANQFISTNMDYYPPGPTQKFYQGCAIFQKEHLTPAERMRGYIATMQDQDDACLPLNHHPDEEEDEDGNSWDILCCYLLPMIGKSDATIWPQDPYSLQTDVKQCQTKYGIDADPNYLETVFGSLSDWKGVNRLIWTNGYNDGWYPLSYTTKPALVEENGILVINMKNGAHHSDLTHELLPVDTPDVQEAHAQIVQAVGEWLDEIRSGDET